MDNIEKLQQLKQLLDEGIISQDEYDSRKERILFPEKAEKERQLQEEENKRQEIFENAIKKFNDKTSESYKQALGELEGLGDWKDATVIAEKYREELSEIEAAEAEKKAEEEKEDTYERAIKKFDIRSSKSYKSAIADLEGLGDWRDAIAIAEEKTTELQEIEEEEKKKKDKVKKKAIIIAAAAVAVIVVVALGKYLLTPNLAKFTPSKSAELNSMKYKVPEGCKLEDSGTDTYALYSLSKSNKVVGVVEVEYRGDSDLSGSAGYDEDTAEHKAATKVAELMTDANGTYQTIEADNSVFEVTVYANDDKVKGKNELLSAMAASFDTSSYKNPRSSEGIETKYTGDTSAGVKIDKGSEGLSVSEKYRTSLGTGTKSVDYTIDKAVTLEAGKTSTVTIKANGQDYKLKVKCSDHGAFYKNGAFNASLDDIMADYKEKHSSVHAYNSTASSGGNIDIVQKGDTYGGQFNCTTTGHKYIVTFNSTNRAGDGNKPTNEVPDSIIMLLQTNGDEEREDLVCIVAIFGNMLSTLNADGSASDAYTEVLRSMQSATGSSVASAEGTYKGIPYSIAYTSGLYTMSINR